MTERVQVGGLQVAKVLFDFVNNEAIPGTGVDAAAFWAGADSVIHDLAPKNRALLAERDRLQTELAQLAREELLHYEQVRELMAKRGIAYRALPAGRYATGLRQHVRTSEPGRLVDLMIIGAFVEARSCERFAAIAPRLDDELKRYYTFLLRSEARHFQHYLGLAEQYAREPIAPRVAFFREVERALIEAPDDMLRFHSGPPALTPVAA